jgi:hypothetical protein
MRTNCHSFDEISTGWTCEYSEYTIIARTCLQCSAAHRVLFCDAIIRHSADRSRGDETERCLRRAEPPIGSREAYRAHC